MGYWFSIPGIDETNYESLIEVNHGTIQYDTESETIFWYLEAITTGPYTMSYIVEIDPSAPSGTHDTNGDTPIHYTNIYGDPAEKPFPILAVTGTGANAILFYHPNGGEGTMDPRTAPIGMTFNLDPNAFTRDGYTFQGWSITQDGAVEYVDKAEFTMPAGGATLYAVWQARTDIEYTVNYLEQGTDRPLAEAKVVGGQTFGSQVTEEAIDIEGYNKVDPTTVTITLAGGNVINFNYVKDSEPHFNVYYHANYEGGSAIQTNTYLEGDCCNVVKSTGKVSLLSVGTPKRTEAESITCQVKNSEMPAEDVNLYAQWAQAVNDNYSAKTLDWQ